MGSLFDVVYKDNDFLGIIAMAGRKIWKIKRQLGAETASRRLGDLGNFGLHPRHSKEKWFFSNFVEKSSKKLPFADA